MVATTETTATTKKKKDDKERKKNNCKDEGKWYLCEAGGTIFLLRDFIVNPFQNHPYEALRTEMKRLEEWNEVVRRC